jgi:hypothetical protein
MAPDIDKFGQTLGQQDDKRGVPGGTMRTAEAPRAMNPVGASFLKPAESFVAGIREDQNLERCGQEGRFGFIHQLDLQLM